MAVRVDDNNDLEIAFCEDLSFTYLVINESAIFLVLVLVGLSAGVAVPILLGRRMMKRPAIATPAAEGACYEIVLRTHAIRHRLRASQHLDGQLVIADESLVLVVRGRSSQSLKYSDVESVDASQFRFAGAGFEGITINTSNARFDLYLYDKGKPATREMSDAVASEIRKRLRRQTG